MPQLIRESWLSDSLWFRHWSLICCGCRRANRVRHTQNIVGAAHQPGYGVARAGAVSHDRRTPLSRLCVGVDLLSVEASTELAKALSATAELRPLVDDTADTDTQSYGPALAIGKRIADRHGAGLDISSGQLLGGTCV